MNSNYVMLISAGALLGSGFTLLIMLLVQYRPTLRRQLRRSTYIPPTIEGRRNARRYSKIQKRVNKQFDNSLIKIQNALDKS